MKVQWQVSFSTLSNALERKHRSLEEWKSFRSLTPRLFSIELGIETVLRRWRSTRKLWYPKEKQVYDAYSFITCCIKLKHQLSEEKARIFRRRIISEILPNGRLCHLDHEFRTAQNLLEFGWTITHFGFCGDPGPDFIARRGIHEIELESKCLSPEIGLGANYQFVGRLMNRLSRQLPSKYPNRFVSIHIRLDGDHQNIETIYKMIAGSYASSSHYCSDALNVEISSQPLHEFLNRFPPDKANDWLNETFAAIRTQEGDYGYFIRRDNELIFINVIPQRQNKQLRKIMKLISHTCEKQLTKQRPSLLWLHFQGLEPDRLDRDPASSHELFERLARHAFQNERRNHLVSIAFSTDADLHLPSPFSLKSKLIQAEGRVRGFDNLNSRFGRVPIFV